MTSTILSSNQEIDVATTPNPVLSDTSADIAVLTDGTSVVVFVDQGVVSFRLYETGGTALGTLQTVAGTTGVEFVEITALSGGGFALAYTEGGNTLHVQYFGATGVPQGSAQTVTTTGDISPTPPDIIELDDGRLLLTWDERETASPFDYSVQGQYLSATGALSGGVFELANTATTAPNSSTTPLSNGGFALVHDVAGASFYDRNEVVLQTFDAAGNSVIGPIQVNTTTTQWQTMADVTELSNGNIAVIWNNNFNLDGSLTGVAGQVFAADGTPVGAEFLVNQENYLDQLDAQLVALPGGGFLVAWDAWHASGNANITGSGQEIMGRIFNNDGTAAGDEFQINVDGSAAQLYPSLAVSAAGDLSVVWQGAEQGGDTWVIDLRQYTVSGGVTPPPPVNTPTTGNDTLSGTEGPDSIDGLAGNDSISGLGGNDTLLGNAGNDTLLGEAGTDSLDGGDGDDSLNGGFGNDTLNGGAGADTLIGGTDQDVLNGGTHGDLLEGQQGDDELNGEGGADTLIGGLGNDTLDGGDLDDWLRGDAGADVLDGGNGNDRLIGGDDSDVAYGRLGNDLFFGGQGFDSLFGLLGDDTLFGGLGNDRLYGGVGNDSLVGADQNDTLVGDWGNDFMDGGTGDDWMNGGGDADYLVGRTGNDTIFGGQGFDTLIGQLGNDVLYSGWGNDQAYGGDGNDELWGGNQNDTLDGGTGIDTLVGGKQNDRLIGGADDDLFVFVDGDGVDVIVDFDALSAAEKLDLSGVSAIANLAALNLGNPNAGAATQVGADVVINTGGGNSVTLLGVNLGDLDGSDFIF